MWDYTYESVVKRSAVIQTRIRKISHKRSNESTTFFSSRYRLPFYRIKSMRSWIFSIKRESVINNRWSEPLNNSLHHCQLYFVVCFSNSSRFEISNEFGTFEVWPIKISTPNLSAEGFRQIITHVTAAAAEAMLNCTPIILHGQRNGSDNDRALRDLWVFVRVNFLHFSLWDSTRDFIF